MNRALLEAQLAQLPLGMIHFFSPRELQFSDRVRRICETECPMYGKSWACPPAVGTVAQCREKCLGFSECLLIASMTEVPDIGNLTETLRTRLPHEDLTDQAAALLRQQGAAPYVLSTEACARCSRCTWPDGPCRHPDRMHPCIESHGINLIPLIEGLGMDFQYGGNVVTWFSLLFFSE